MRGVVQKKIWFLQIPIVILAILATFALSEFGSNLITNFYVRQELLPPLTNIANFFVDLKFKFRGPQPPKDSRIVILTIDDISVEAVGRWPWHRNVTAEVLNKTFLAGAKVIGLDMVFSEEDVRVSDELFQQLQTYKLGHLKAQVETDPLLAKTISENADRLVLGWTPQGSCQPRFSNPEKCPLIMHSDEITYPENFGKFALRQNLEKFPVKDSILFSSFDMLANLEIFSAAAKHSGFFQAFPDADGVIRKAPLIQIVDGKAFPSLALKMASLIRNEQITVNLSTNGQLQEIYYEDSKKRIGATPSGFIKFNSRGPGYTFPYVNALDVLSIGEDLDNDQLKKSIRAQKILKDAYVLVGLSALGAADLRAFTFDKIVPGVEGHATILDNLLADDYIRTQSGFPTYILLILGGLAFAYALQRLRSIQGLVATFLTLASTLVFDYKVLFQQNQDWNLCFFYVEVLCIFFVTVMAKYIIEEKDKTFIRKAFSRYLSPDFVDLLIKDQSKLALGGEKRNLAILFSDIRGFTTFSESVDAKTLSHFLNEYLGLMTQIIFESKGTLDKYIGDAVMAFWGAPLDVPESASLACEAAMKMLRTVRIQQSHFLQTFGIDLQIGIGVNFGSVNVGNMGSDKNFSYTVIGDHVNTASRIESLTKHYGVNILTTRFTIDAILAEGSIPPVYRTLDFVKVKGKKQVIEVIELLEADIPTECKIAFAEARRFYLLRDWLSAIEQFSLAHRTFKILNSKDDSICLLYIKRCEDFILRPPHDEWDGVWEMHEK